MLIWIKWKTDITWLRTIYLTALKPLVWYLKIIQVGLFDYIEKTQTNYYFIPINLLTNPHIQSNILLLYHYYTGRYRILNGHFQTGHKKWWFLPSIISLLEQLGWINIVEQSIKPTRYSNRSRSLISMSRSSNNETKMCQTAYICHNYKLCMQIKMYINSEE